MTRIYNIYSKNIFFQGQSVILECKITNGEEYPILLVKKQDEDVFPLSAGKTLIVKNTAKFNLRCGRSIINLLKQIFKINM